MDTGISDMNAKAGQMIDRYQIVALLGEGGMGSVYKAHDLTLQRDVAIKLMHPQFAHQPDFQERFLQEARTAARLDHPSIVQVHDFGQFKGQLYIVMEFIPGDNLGQILRALRATNQWIPLTEALPLLRLVCLALHYAHQHGVLHRDIKPDNLMLKPEPADGLPYRPIITDLGLAKLAEGGLMTQEGTSMGTPAYMSPEQALAQPTDARSDVYSLGILLFELATGRLPFAARSLPEAIRCHTQELPPAPRSIRPELPEALEQVILKSLHKDPAQRFPSAADFAKAIQTVIPLIKPISGQPTTIGETVSLITQFQKSLLAARGPSIIKEMQPVDPNQDAIQVLKDGKTTAYPIRKAELVIGRDESCDIQLDDAKVSRSHARLEIEKNAVYLTDLNSTNGTFLENTRLLPGVRELWTAEKTVRIGGHWLRLTRTSKPAGEIPGTLAHDPLTSPVIPAPAASPTPQIAINLQETVYSAEPGTTVAVPITLVNQGSIVDHFTFQLSGIPEAWIAAALPRQHMLPGEKYQTSILLRPPRESSAREGNYPVQLTLVSESTARAAASVSFTLQVLPYAQFTSDLHPEKIRAGKVSRLVIANQGNASERYDLKFQDRADALTFQASQTELQLVGGQSAEIQFTARSKETRWIGAEQSMPFTVQIAASLGEKRAHTGEVIQRGLIPSWAPGVLAALCLLLTVAGVVGYNQVQGQANRRATQTSDAILAVIAAQTASAIPPTLPTAPPTQTPQITEQVTETTQPTVTTVPSPTASNLTAEILLPDPAVPVTKELVFQVKASDPAVGTDDGAGIDSVTLRILNPEQKLVHEKVEEDAPYCGFGGNTPECSGYHFVSRGNTWSSGDRVTNGEYTLQAVVQAADGRSTTLQSKVKIERLNRILFVSEQGGSKDLYSIYEDGSDLTPITQQMGVECCVTWSPDGSRYAFVSTRDGNQEIYAGKVDSPDLSNLTRNSAQDYAPIWSPDSRQIAFLSTQSGGGSSSDVYLINADGSDLRQLTTTAGNDSYLAWSPDGEKISFSTDFGDGNWDIFTINRDGSNLTQLTNDTFFDAAASWSNDGSQIAFISSRTDRTFMPYLMQADGSGQTLLVNAAASGIITRWTPDGKKIAFLTTPNNGSTGIFTVNPDGSDLTRVTDALINAGTFDWQSSGEFLVLMHAYDIYVVSQDGSLTRNLTNSKNVIDFDPAWQP